MKCPLCNAPTDIVDTRKRTDNTIVRRRVCFNYHVFKTQETPITEPKIKQDKT